MILTGPREPGAAICAATWDSDLRIEGNKRRGLVIVTNGRAGPNGVGCGLKVSVLDRDAFFNREWDSVSILLPTGESARVNTAKSSF